MSSSEDESKESDSTTENHSQSGLPTVEPRARFTHLEDQTILNYIIENGEVGRIHGRQLWIRMAQWFGNGRSWQALRERFRCHIIKNIHLYDLTQQDQELFVR